MSRPRWSVPNQCSPVGAPSVYAASVEIGSCVWRTAAKRAVTTITSMSTPPAAPSGFFRKKRPSAVHAPPRARGSAPTASSAGLTATIADSRIQDAIQHVYGEVRQDHHDRDEHHEGLDDRVVAPEDRVHEEAGDAREVEHALGDDQAPDEKSELDPDHGDHRQHRVLEGVAPDDDAAGLALGPRRADVVLAQHLEERGARDAHDQRRGA